MTLALRSLRWLGLSAMVCVGLSACASYEPAPLDTAPQAATSLAALQHSQPLNTSGPLDLASFVLLAVENNPDLKVARADRGVAGAQVLQAGLLPNPSITGSYGFLLGGPGTADSWTAGLTEDIRALVTLSAQRRSAEFEVGKVDADILWQEWQIIGKARLLFVDTVEQEKLYKSLLENRRLFADRSARSQRALQQGDIDLTAAAPDLSALSDLDKQIYDLERQIEGRQHDLDALLNLSPEVKLDLAPDIVLPRIDPAAIEQLLPQLPNRRPDLLALQLGYQSQEQKLRGAILAQFPTLVFGGTGGSDTSRVKSFGPQITMDLPIFNRNQGNIAIEGATRERLHAEYTNRLTAAIGDIKAMLAEQALLQRQLDKVSSQLDEAKQVSDHAEAAFRAGNIDERGYVDLKMVFISKQQQMIVLEQALLEQQVAIATLIGAEMPAASSPPLTAERRS
jgi:outer membrane protein TolC